MKASWSRQPGHGVTTHLLIELKDDLLDGGVAADVSARQRFVTDHSSRTPGSVSEAEAATAMHL